MLMAHHLGIVIITSSMVIAAAICFVIRKIFSFRILQAHHEVAFPIFLQIGVIYAMLLSMTFSLVWDGFKDTQQDLELEASSLITLMHLAQGLPNPTRQQIQVGISRYAYSIVTREWETMKSQHEDLQTWQLLNDVEKIYLNFQPKNVTENDIYMESLKRLADARTYRRIRIFQVTGPRPIGLWVMLGIMGVVVIGISYLFGMEYLWPQVALTAALTGIIALIVLVIVVMGRPYSGAIPIMKPKPFEDAIQKFTLIEKSSNSR